MNKVIVQESGYRISVTSWENDADNYNFKSITVESKEDARAVTALIRILQDFPVGLLASLTAFSLTSSIGEMKMHTLTIADLDDFEAEHVSQILRDYKTKMMADKIHAFVEDHKDGGHRVEWYDKHLAWHDEIMKKVKWVKDA